MQAWVYWKECGSDLLRVKPPRGRYSGSDDAICVPFRVRKWTANCGRQAGRAKLAWLGNLPVYVSKRGALDAKRPIAKE